MTGGRCDSLRLQSGALTSPALGRTARRTGLCVPSLLHVPYSFMYRPLCTAADTFLTNDLDTHVAQASCPGLASEHGQDARATEKIAGVHRISAPPCFFGVQTQNSNMQINTYPFWMVPT
jgi:hypothetical protein